MAADLGIYGRRVILKERPTFVWLYLKIGTSDKCDINCI
jgi:hypothetical protein